MSAEDKQTILIRDIPRDVFEELGRRAKENYRNRTGEIRAVLTAYCRGRLTLAGVGVGEMMPTADGTGVPYLRNVATSGDARDGDEDGKRGEA